MRQLYPDWKHKEDIFLLHQLFPFLIISTYKL